MEGRVRRAGDTELDVRLTAILVPVGEPHDDVTQRRPVRIADIELLEIDVCMLSPVWMRGRSVCLGACCVCSEYNASMWWNCEGVVRNILLWPPWRVFTCAGG